MPVPRAATRSLPSARKLLEALSSKWPSSRTSLPAERCLPAGRDAKIARTDLHVRTVLIVRTALLARTASTDLFVRTDLGVRTVATANHAVTDRNAADEETDPSAADVVAEEREEVREALPVGAIVLATAADTAVSTSTIPLRSLLFKLKKENKRKIVARVTSGVIFSILNFVRR